MNLLNKLTIKNLKLNRKRTTVTIIGIILSVALITAVATMYSSGIKSLIAYETHEYGEFHVRYDDVPATEISKFKNNKKIEDIFLTQNVGYAKIDSKNENKPYAFIKVFTEKSLENLSVKLVEGRLPKNSNEILVPTHLRTNGRIELNVGDEITLDVGKRINEEGYELNQSNPFYAEDQSEFTINAKTEEIISDEFHQKSQEKIIDTEKKTYKVVGIIERPASNIEDYSAPGYTFITYIDEDSLNGNVELYAKYTKEGVNDAYNVTANILGVDEELFEKVQKETDMSDSTMEEYAKEMEKAKYQITMNTYLIGLETNPLQASGIKGLGAVAVIICIIIVVTSVFCIKNSFDISITEKIKQYGMLRSIGATKKQIRKNVFFEATILGTVGIPLGVLLGILASYILVIVSNYFLEDLFAAEGFKLVFAFSYIPILIAIILGIITIYLSAFRSSRRASKVSPIDSIRNSANIKINAKKIKSPKIIKKIFGVGGEISFKNLKRNKKKYRTTVISIVVSVFIFVALSSFMSMAFETIDNELNISDYNVSLSAYNFEGSYDKYIETVKLNDIEDYTILRTAEIEVGNAKYNKEYVEWLEWSDETIEKNETSHMSIMAIGEDQYKKYIKSLGLKYEDTKDKGILCDYANIQKSENEIKNMRIFDYNSGDKISGKLEDDKTIDIQIYNITKEKPFGLKNRDFTWILVSDELYDKTIETNGISILYKSNDADKLQDNIEELLKGDKYFEVYNLEENVKMLNNLYTLVGIFLYGFIIVISLIGITNIFNTITTNMELRKPEFAMLKSIGMTSKEFKKMIRLESIFMGIKALFYGLPIGIGLSYLIYHYLAESSGMVYKLPMFGITISIIAVFLLITSLMRYSMNKINKQNTIETIRNENI